METIKTEIFDTFSATIKRSSNGKLVAQVQVDKLEAYIRYYAGETVKINGSVYDVTSAGKEFRTDRGREVYLYLAECGASQDNEVCARCGTHCCGDCSAN